MVRIKWGIAVNVPRVILAAILVVCMFTAPDFPPGVGEVVFTLLLCFTFLISALAFQKEDK